MNWTTNNTECRTWFERDRAHVSLLVSEEIDSPYAGYELLSFWDGEVAEMVEAGFLTPRDWHGSAVEFANQMNVSYPHFPFNGETL